MSIKINIKWGKNVYNDVEINTAETGEVFKSQVFSLTGVPPERQKFMGIKGIKGGALPDDVNWSSLTIKPGQSVMLMGAASELAKQKEKTVFVEDMSDAQLAAAAQAGKPPGLVNLGNTCYMNSTLQALRTVPELKSALLDYSGSRQATGAADHNVVVATRDLMGQLESSKVAVPPLIFLNEFRAAHPQFAQRGQTGQYSQQDAEEAMRQLLLSLGKIPGKSGGGSRVDNLFGGSFETEMKLAEGEAPADGPPEPPQKSSENWLMLKCFISEKVSHLHEGIRLSLEDSLEKTSPSLGRTAQYSIKSRISSLPPYVIVQYVRFYWKASIQQRAKILRVVSFGATMDLYDFCTESLQAELRVHRNAGSVFEDARVAALAEGKTDEEARAAGDAAVKEAAKDAPPVPSPPGTSGDAPATPAPPSAVAGGLTGNYDLSAIVSHQGRTPDSGHYVAWVKGDKPKEWLQFDDDTVHSVSEETVMMLKGGADSHIAYMAVYKAKPGNHAAPPPPPSGSK